MIGEEDEIVNYIGDKFKQWYNKIEPYVIPFNHSRYTSFNINYEGCRLTIENQHCHLTSNICLEQYIGSCIRIIDFFAINTLILNKLLKRIEIIARQTPIVRYIVYHPTTKLHGVTTDKYLTTMQGPEVLFLL